MRNLFQKYGSYVFGTFIVVVYFNETVSSTDCIMSKENNELRRMCEDDKENGRGFLQAPDKK